MSNQNFEDLTSAQVKMMKVALGMAEECLVPPRNRNFIMVNPDCPNLVLSSLIKRGFMHLAEGYKHAEVSNPEEFRSWCYKKLPSTTYTDDLTKRTPLVGMFIYLFGFLCGFLCGFLSAVVFLG